MKHIDLFYFSLLNIKDSVINNQYKREPSEHIIDKSDYSESKKLSYECTTCCLSTIVYFFMSMFV